MIFFAEEPAPKASDPEAGPTETGKAAASPDAAVQSAPAGQPALFAAPTAESSAPGAMPPEAAGSEPVEPAAAEEEAAATTEPVPTVEEPAATVQETAASAGDPPPRKKPARKKKAAAPAAPVAATDGAPFASADEVTEKRAVIKVIGVGGGGGNAVNRMIEAGVTGVEFIAANTDAQVLELSHAPVKVQLGIERTGGLGCGGDPEVGRLAARDDMDRLIDVLAGADMIFITVGEGGGTGTGAAPVIACVAQEIKALCIAVATKPMSVEGKQRRTTANDGIRELREFVDTLICVPNDRVVEVYGNLKIRDAFRSADDVVRQAVQGISDLIQVPGEINLDFADVRSAMRLRGDAVMGIGQASGEDRVEEATEAAISSPLLEDTSIQGATSIIVNVTGGDSLTLNEVQRAVQVVRDAVAPEGTGIYGSADPEPGDNILIGTALDPRMDATGEIKVTVVATGFPDRNRANATPNDFANYTTRATGTFGARGVAPSAAGSGPAGPAERAGGRVGRTIPKLDTHPTIAESDANRVEAKGHGNGANGDRADVFGSGSRPVIDEPMSLPEDSGDDRWGDLETPPYLTRRG
ncbi:MAG: cell division protein FtsZ [Acidobacteriota bacterium]|nr:cell division protein FtsZ [Acidobacteriota bacterium]